MTLDSLLHEIESRGIRLRVIGGRLAVKPASALTSELREILSDHRDEVLARLAVSLSPSQSAIQAVAHRYGSTVRGDAPATDPRIPPVVAAQIRQIEAQAYRLGWSRERLWNGDFWPHSRARPRGLASVLNSGDQIIEVNAEFMRLVCGRNTLRFFRWDS